MATVKYIFTWTILLVISQITHAHPSWGIVVDQNENIYFADILHNEMGSVWKLTNKGKLELLFENFHAHNVSLDADGNLITAHGENNHTMVRLNSDGKIDTLYHRLNHEEFNGGNSTYTPLGEIVFVAENYLWRVNQYGDKEKLSEYKLGWSQTVYADENGNYYAPDIGDGLGKLIKIDSTGSSTIIATNLISKLDRPFDRHADILMGITLGCDGHVYVAELAGKRIIKVLDNQKTETFYISSDGWFPTGVDFFSGNAYILEYKSKNGHEGPRIVKIDESGVKTILFNYDNYQKGAISPITKDNTNWFWWIGSAAIITLSTVILWIRRNKKLLPITKHSSGR
ncbi:NHL repeat-containing protein [Mangrovivirga cuniculi]|uniref:Uncharacterized protein n=1 Tax=Mangrovivirga cuniculi TaxID=2715131 RepID=A0A4D7JRG2_9BACT|nr:hypothetical protein [Mangrovivirga cuniculi]QCK16110.1 hypothetical protein DCC35_15865 [Mangrovivirga cuniculi]